MSGEHKQNKVLVLVALYLLAHPSMMPYRSCDVGWRKQVYSPSILGDA